MAEIKTPKLLKILNRIFANAKAKLYELLAACREIESLKNEISVLQGLKDSREFAEKEIERLRGKMTDTTTTIKEHSEDIEFF